MARQTRRMNDTIIAEALADVEKAYTISRDANVNRILERAMEKLKNPNGPPPLPKSIQE